MRNLPCQKRRHVVIRNKDGTTEETYRCANGASKRYKQDVFEIACQTCTLRQPLLKIGSVCKEYLPKDPIWPEPVYVCGRYDGLIYPYQENVEKPPIPKGYKREEEDGIGAWNFIDKWPKCPYRQMMNQRTPRGDLQIKAYCSIRNNMILDLKTCEECSKDIEKVGGHLNEENIKASVPLPEPINESEEDIPEYPGLNELLSTYWKAVRRWIAAGRPQRTDKEVEQIHNDFCARCNWYDSESERCKGCGCKVKPVGTALLNKIKMKTEHCPRSYW